MKTSSFRQLMDETNGVPAAHHIAILEAEAGKLISQLKIHEVS